MDSVWINYFSIIAAVTGSIFALMFVALQVGMKRWKDNPTGPFLAVLALIELLTPLAISVTAIHPVHNWQVGALLPSLIGLCAIAWYFKRLRSLGHSFKMKLCDSDDFWAFKVVEWLYIHGSFIISAPIYSALVVIAIRGLVFGIDCGLLVVSWLCLWLVFSGVVESWILLVRSADENVSNAINSASHEG
ncbi:hypothetical protein [Lolliginicoccus suaedae]|uniref:hypothetical protein n=1 Tax=Lolliginicoccus suaedae TaxID=2605429 RepID=UPI0011EC4334|nr:hypothetical protein [Lolliginicoccus suaedae]